MWKDGVEEEDKEEEENQDMENSENYWKAQQQRDPFLISQTESIKVNGPKENAPKQHRKQQQSHKRQPLAEERAQLNLPHKTNQRTQRGMSIDSVRA